MCHLYTTQRWLLLIANLFSVYWRIHSFVDLFSHVWIAIHHPRRPVFNHYRQHLRHRHPEGIPLDFQTGRSLHSFWDILPLRSSTYRHWISRSIFTIHQLRPPLDVIDHRQVLASYWPQISVGQLLTTDKCWPVIDHRQVLTRASAICKIWL